ncbi:MAG: hypothetical protein ACN4GZ_19255 [Acidimicrobiales bacterium]
MNQPDPDPPDPGRSPAVAPPPEAPQLSPTRRAALKRRDRRIQASSSWRAFFSEFALRLGLLIVVILVVWALSLTR